MHDKVTNMLGATALALSDSLLASATAAAGLGASGAAALVVLSTDPGLSVTELGRRIGLSQPAAARMVESLERRGLVERRRTWGSWVAVHSTEQGARAASALLRSRGDALRDAVLVLDEDEREQLELLLAKLLRGLYAGPGDAEHLCRLCDRRACLDGGEICPVGQADREARADDQRDGGVPRAGRAERWERSSRSPRR